MIKVYYNKGNYGMKLVEEDNGRCVAQILNDKKHILYEIEGPDHAKVINICDHILTNLV